MGGLVDGLMNAVVGWLARFVLDAIKALVAVAGRTAFFVPDITLIPQVQAIWRTNAAIANTAYVLAIVVAGVYVMSYETVQARYTVKDLAPRLVFGAVAGNFSLQWCSQIFVAADALLRAVTAKPIVGDGALATIEAQVDEALRGPASLLLVLLCLLIVVLVVALLATWVVRFGVLIVLVAAAPLALACHCLPVLEPTARLWWRALVGALGTQLLQALTLYIGLTVFLDPASAIPTQVGIDGGALLNLLVLVVLLWTTVKIPGLMARYVTRGSSANLATSVLRLVVVQQLTRGLRPRGLVRAGGVR
jgi:hypothetical protein